MGAATASQSSRSGRLLWLIFVALLSTLSLVAVLLARQWIGVFITRSIVRRATIAFLVGLEVVYVVGWMALLAGTVSCGALLWRGRCNRTKWQMAARGLLLCVCTLMAIGLAELAVRVAAVVERAGRFCPGWRTRPSGPV